MSYRGDRYHLYIKHIISEIICYVVITLQIFSRSCQNFKTSTVLKRNMLHIIKRNFESTEYYKMKRQRALSI